MPDMVRVIAAKPFKYGTRRLQPGDEITMTKGHARIHGAIRNVKAMEERQPGSLPPPPASLPNVAAQTKHADPEPKSDLDAARDLYHEKMGKRAYHGWDVDELMRRMEAAEKPADKEDDQES